MPAPTRRFTIAHRRDLAVAAMGGWQTVPGRNGGTVRDWDTRWGHLSFGRSPSPRCDPGSFPVGLELRRVGSGVHLHEEGRQSTHKMRNTTKMRNSIKTRTTVLQKPQPYRPRPSRRDLHFRVPVTHQPETITMSGIKLYYFVVRARAEPIHLTLVAAGKKFEDIKLTGEQWAAQKDKSPFAQMPYIEYNGKTYGESKAVAGFVARECGLAGKSNVDGMKVDEVYCLVGSLLEAMGKCQFEKEIATKEKLQKELVEVTIPKYMSYFERMLKESGTGFFVGKALSQADLSVYDITYSLLKDAPKLLDSFPGIQKMRKNVEANKAVKAYLDSRPDTDL